MSLFARWAPAAARLLLGLVFVVFGSNYFLNFLPSPPPMPERALTFVGGLIAGGYVFPVIKSIEIAAGLMLLSNRFVPLALTLLAPIIVNIAAVHYLLAPAFALPTVILGLELFLAYSYRGAFAPMLRANVAPEPAAQHARELGAPALELR
ncbi:MAG: DoxX family protein [Myxococcales bacterium]